MPPKSKIKSAAPKNIHRNAPERKMHFLLGEKVVFWLLVMMTVALVTAIFGNVDVRSLVSEQPIKIVEKIVEVEKEITTTNKPPTSLNSECYTENPGGIETYFTYFDKKASVSMALPYSFSWGSLNCPPVQRSVYPEGLESIRFGPSVKVEGGDVARDTSLSIRDVTSASAIRAEIEKELSGDEVANPSAIKQKNVNGLTVFSYSYYSLGEIRVWIAVGRNNVYELASKGWLTDAEAAKIIQSLRVKK